MVEQERTTLRRARRLLVDGNNVVGGRDEGRIAAVAAAVKRIVAPGVDVEVFRDGGARSADDDIVEAIGTPHPGTADRIVVVTDDHALAARCRALGASIVGASYVRTLISEPPHRAVTGGGGRPPSIGGTGPRRNEPTAADAGDARSWRPGRGSTKKRGPATRPPRHR